MLIIADINGHTTTMFTSHLPAGEHLFRITLANKGNYVMAASQNRENKSITMMCNECGGSDQIEYQGMATAHNPTPHLCLNTTKSMTKWNMSVTQQLMMKKYQANT